MNLLEKLRIFFDQVSQGDPDSIWLLVVIYTFIVCIYSSIYQIRVRTWPSTNGKLSSTQIDTFGSTLQPKSQQEFISRVLYDYEVDGDQYTGHKLSTWIVIASFNLKSLLSRQLAKISLDENDNLKVYYNPNNPKKSVLLKPGIIGLSFTIAMGVLPLAITLMNTG